ncbi:alpha/beta hydrolase fold domain-containing protein [Pseudonocardia sp. KRD291]|uniref:alpha/beta hydrolase fold domain-containing protein n=1 Tax=Pseudonocardia sp. KRD291 TaxID=2792007 RepID=UPI001C49D936|nr:alpha/beta hydrolase fold domain-containing protein [Pseudonocardia sp. KRD291]MBW0100947.1 alpha/beta hydrolase [Pseudonocardia sp. KRD291]
MRPQSGWRQASWQARACAHLVRWTIRPLVELVPDTDLVIRSTRRALRAFTDLVCRPHPAASIRPVRAMAPSGLEIRGEWVLPPVTGRGLPNLGGGVVFYVHGSGYAVASARTHRAITSRLAVRTRRPVFACDYRLAPTHRYPAAADDVAAAFDWLLAQGASPARTVIAGDSAGGQLSIALATELTARGTCPAGVLLFSPLIDLSLTEAHKWEDGHSRDPLVSVRRVERLLALYLDGTERASAGLQITAAGLTGLPPVQVHVSGSEFLCGDARYLAELVELAGGDVELLEWPGQLHVFQALAGFVPEATRSLREAADFVRARLDPVTPDSTAGSYT